MPYLKQSEIQVGTLVLDDYKTVCLVTEIGTGLDDDRVKITYPCGKHHWINRLYIRRMPQCK